MQTPAAPDTFVLTRRAYTGVILGLLVGAFVSFTIAPWLMPDSYSAVENAISESAGQGVQNAWLARTGFLLLGFAVLLTANATGSNWNVWGRVAHRTYGVAIIAAAAYAHMPWEDEPYDRFEDFLHSVAASAVGLAFIVGVLLVSIGRPAGRAGWRAFDWFAVIASMGISMMMFNFVEYAGAMQRTMFATGMVWYGLEAIRWWRGEPTVSEDLAPSETALVSAQRT